MTNGYRTIGELSNDKFPFIAHFVEQVPQSAGE